jgi:hypothetical protein
MYDPKQGSVHGQISFWDVRSYVRDWALSDALHLYGVWIYFLLPRQRMMIIFVREGYDRIWI